MRNRDREPRTVSERIDEQALRARLHTLVDDVQPADDSLSRVLAAQHRRGFPRRSVLAAGGVAVAATAALLLVLLTLPGIPSRRTEPVGVAPDTYFTQTRPGVVALAGLESGRAIREVGRVAGRVTSMAADGRTVYAVVSGTTDRIVELAPGRAPEVVGGVAGEAPITALAAGGGVLAYVSHGSAVLLRDGHSGRIPVPGDSRVVDVALDSRGRLAVLITGEAPGGSGAALYVLAPGATTLAGREPIRPELGCAPVAVTWSGGRVAALHGTDCAAGGSVRIASFAPRTGRLVAPGTPFSPGADSLLPGDVQLSADSLGRFLVSARGHGWLVDGPHVTALPPACGGDGSCVGGPSVLRPAR